MFRRSLLAAMVAGSALLPVAVQAAPAFVVGMAAMHAGPDEDFPMIRMIHDGRLVTVYGCLDDWSWCDVSYHGDRGWVDGDDLVADYDGGRERLVAIAPVIGIGVLAFSFGTYWDHYYRGRPFYSERPRWEHYTSEHYRPHWGGNEERGRQGSGGWSGRDNHRDDNRGGSNGDHRQWTQQNRGAPPATAPQRVDDNHVRNNRGRDGQARERQANERQAVGNPDQHRRERPQSAQPAQPERHGNPGFQRAVPTSMGHQPQGQPHQGHPQGQQHDRGDKDHGDKGRDKDR